MGDTFASLGDTFASFGECELCLRLLNMPSLEECRDDRGEEGGGFGSTEEEAKAEEEEIFESLVNTAFESLANMEVDGSTGSVFSSGAAPRDGLCVGRPIWAGQA